MKIVVLDGHCENPGDISWEELEKLGELTVYERTPNNTNDVVERIGDADVVFVNKVKITKEILDKCPNIKFIGVLATGYNVVDLKSCDERKIPVANVPTYSTDSVAQFTFGLILEICHHIGAHSDGVLAGKWCRSIDFSYWDYPMAELKGKTLGIVGFGKIGKATAKIADAFGMKVLAYSRHEFSSDIAKYVSLDELYRESDFVTLHCPLNGENEKMINASSISKMKDGVIIINTARGGLINEKDLCEAINNDKVAYAAVDVVSEEPIKDDNPLLKAKNIIITPHIAWASKEARERLMETTVANLKAFIDGHMQNIVNFK